MRSEHTEAVLMCFRAVSLNGEHKDGQLSLERESATGVLGIGHWKIFHKGTILR